MDASSGAVRVACHAALPSVPIRVAVPVPNKTGWAGSATGASQTVKAGGSGWLASSVPGLVSVSRLLIVAGARVTETVAVPPTATVEEIVKRAPTLSVLGLLRPVQRPVASQVLTRSLWIFGGAALEAMA